MRNLILPVVVTAIAVVGGIALWSTVSEHSEYLAGEEQTVRAVVTDFGSRLSSVSLLAPDDVVRQQIRQAYAPFVSEELLETWLENPAAAPGRLISSPWPDRIEVSSASKADDVYTIVGTIVLMTSTEMTSAEDDDAGRRPVTVTVAKVDGEWIITALHMEN